MTMEGRQTDDMDEQLRIQEPLRIQAELDLVCGLATTLHGHETPLRTQATSLLRPLLARIHEVDGEWAIEGTDWSYLKVTQDEGVWTGGLWLKSAGLPLAFSVDRNDDVEGIQFPGVWYGPADQAHCIEGEIDQAKLPAWEAWNQRLDRSHHTGSLPAQLKAIRKHTSGNAWREMDERLRFLDLAVEYLRLRFQLLHEWFPRFAAHVEGLGLE